VLLNGFLEFTSDVIRTGWNVDEPHQGLAPAPLEVIRLVRSHRAPEPAVPTSLVPDEVARVEKRRSLPVRPSWLGGAR
jgi:hypothetical protein